jgi:hypothetical protein
MGPEVTLVGRALAAITGVRAAVARSSPGRITHRAGRVGELEAAKVEDQAATSLFSSPQLLFELLHAGHVQLSE